MGGKLVAWLAVVSLWLAVIALVLYDALKPLPSQTWSLQDTISFAALIFNILTFAGAAVGVLIAYYAFQQTRRQADAADLQTNIAKDTSKRQLRAYVFVTANPIEDFSTGKKPSGSVSVQMIGQTPAYNSRVVTAIGTLRYPLTSDIDGYLPSKSVEETKSILFPGLKFGNSVALAYAPSAEQFEILKQAERARIFLWGKVTYDDAFGAPHRVLFCFNFDHPAEKPGSTEICNQHVEAD
ncbi:hypothetical protein ACWAUC_15195 [Bradyrhizobium guangdongense]